MLQDGQVDAAIIFRYDDTVPDDIRAIHLFDDPMYLLSLEPGQRCEITATHPGSPAASTAAASSSTPVSRPGSTRTSCTPATM